jgi:uncharacterized membrane protein YhaH (DUF805 family)
MLGYWKRVVLENYANFSGRARRAEYWWFGLANAIIYVVLFVLSIAAKALIVLVVLYGLAMIIPGLAVAVRRMHDIGKSGAWLFISLVPFVGGIILLVLTLTDSQQGSNQYGPSEKYPSRL